MYLAQPDVYPISEVSLDKTPMRWLVRFVDKLAEHLRPWDFDGV